ncbi:hypothetical protein AKJ29_00135 [Aliiroseovarius crassostreae]|uniref:UbiC transcription regulator-associated domain-containing protein n=1 Tax=Aliiroseovarius crassostreae TaxID=154981 RepID=A0A0P7J0L5_9RHOB|nr:hypothetical protein AKJ29_00135 [Aliiroseovarius crassostreae]
MRNKPYTRFDLRIYAISADEATARTLATDPGSALLVIERTTWIGADPITSVRSITLPGYQLLTNS